MEDLDLIPIGTLEAWLDAQAIGTGPIRDASLLSGGTQNILLRFTRNDESLILRRPPRHKRASSDAAMEREATVLASLAGSAVPHPRLRGSSNDQSIFGASFFVMDSVDGFCAPQELPDSIVSRAAAGQKMADSAVRALATLRTINIGDAPLNKIGNAEGWLPRQVTKWLTQLGSYAELEGWTQPDLPGLEAVVEWLSAHIPSEWTPGLIHGDFHLGNILFNEASLDVAAIIDWELATLGAPMVDLGHLMATWPDPHEPRTAGLPRYPDNFPDRAVLADKYAELFPEDAVHIPWFYAFACFRLAVLLEGTHARSLAGKASPEVGVRFHGIAQSLIDQASAVVRAPHHQ